MATRPAPSAALLTIGLELLGVAVLTLLAGASPEAGTIVLIIMSGFWLIYAISESNILVNVVDGFTSLVYNPTNSSSKSVTSGIPYVT
jgi:hypothetical protein